MPVDELYNLIKSLEDQMRGAAEALAFEQAASLRDQIFEIREVIAARENLEPWEKIRFLSEG